MNTSISIAVRVFVPFAGGYFLSYLYRVVNAVIAPDLVSDLGIGPSAPLTTFSQAAFFPSRAFGQVPG